MPTRTTLTTAAHLYLLAEPTRDDTARLAELTRAAGGTLTAHPDTIAALHAAAVTFGPIVHRTTLAAVLDVTVAEDPGLQPGLVAIT